MNHRFFFIKNLTGNLLLSLFLLSVRPAGCKAQEKNTSANYVISYPQAMPKEVIEDMQHLLQQSTGQRWDAVVNRPIDAGITLSLRTAGDYKTGESCLVNSDGSSYAKFEAPTTNGLIYGVYKYLRDLGFKFYLPDSLYTVVPHLNSVFKKTAVMETPFLHIRDFFGTGGFGSGKTDPTRSVERSWQLWKWRNGFGAEFLLSGHVGETFNLANGNELAKNPSWTATPIMNNGQVNPTTKLNYFNTAAVDFFTDWVLRKFTDKNYTPPPVYLRDMVSIEPADGGGYVATPPAGSDLKTISDQVFNAANVAAKKLDRLFPNQPNIGVNLYAYSEHADVPNFSLNPRVFVQIIPYQFQNIAYGPAFIKRWSEKVKRFGLYDYFKYPDSYWDLPGGYPIDELMKRAINAAQAGSEGTTYESSYSELSTGIPLWVLCQYMCTGNTDWNKSYDDLINDLYGSAASSVKKLFDIFYRQAQFGIADLNKAVNYIQEAEKLSTDPRVSARINDLKTYMSYVSLYLKSQDLETGSLDDRLLPVEKMAWTMYQSKIIDSYRIMQLASYSFLNAKTPDKALAEHYHKVHLMTFPESDDPDVYWKKNYKYSRDELDKMFYAINEPGKQARSMSFTPAAIADEIAAAKVSYQPKENITLQGNYTVRGYFSLFTEKPSTLIINWSLTNSKNEPPSGSISGTDKSYKAVYDYPLQSSSGKLSISIPAGESAFFINAGSYTTYTLQLKLDNAFSYFDGSPRDKMSFLNDKGNYSYDPVYFPTYVYVPKNVTEVQYKVQVDGIKISAPDGSPVTTKLIKTLADGTQLRSFSVSPDLTGRFWQITVLGNYNYQFLNIPDRYFLFAKK